MCHTGGNIVMPANMEAMGALDPRHMRRSGAFLLWDANPKHRHGRGYHHLSVEGDCCAGLVTQDENWGINDVRGGRDVSRSFEDAPDVVRY